MSLQIVQKLFIKIKPFSIAKRLAECYISIDACSNLGALARLEVLRMRALAWTARCTQTMISRYNCPFPWA
jgi:hypothetical protein